jgi:hypothetical protein
LSYQQPQSIKEVEDFLNPGRQEIEHQIPDLSVVLRLEDAELAWCCDFCISL